MMDPTEDFANIVVAEDSMNAVAEKRQAEAKNMESVLKGAQRSTSLSISRSHYLLFV